MTEANHAAQQQEAPFGAFKKAVAKLIDAKRLRHGVDFAEDASIQDVFVGERQYNMGDLWRERTSNNSMAKRPASQLDLFDTQPDETHS